MILLYDYIVKLMHLKYKKKRYKLRWRSGRWLEFCKFSGFFRKEFDSSAFYILKLSSRSYILFTYHGLFSLHPGAAGRLRSVIIIVFCSDLSIFMR